MSNDSVDRPESGSITQREIIYHFALDARGATERPGSEMESNGRAIICANEAINCLRRIPLDDALRRRAFEIVRDWLTAWA